MKTIIIAEAGVNHNGDINNAYKLIDKAIETGADIIKFQTYKSEKLVSRNAQKADYQKKNTNDDDSQLEMLKKYELSYDDFRNLKKYCEEKGIRFLSTAFDLESVEFLHSLNMGIWKIPSGEITNLPYIIKIARYHEPVILSTGMSNISEIRDAVNILKENGADDITVLHCTTEYPAPFADVNLKAMLTIKERFGVKIGYSDHTEGIEVPIAAVALGASIIEKHFTLDRNLPGPDHKASLEPRELKQMVLSIRNIEKSLGNGSKTVSDSERKNINIARKSIVAKTDIKIGDIFSENNLTTKRPGNGISPMRWFDLLGKKSKKEYEEDSLIEISELNE